MVAVGMSSSSHTCQVSRPTDLDGERLRLAVDGGRGDVGEALVADRLVGQLSERLRLHAPVVGGVHEVQVLCGRRNTGPASTVPDCTEVTGCVRLRTLPTRTAAQE